MPATIRSGPILAPCRRKGIQPLFENLQDFFKSANRGAMTGFGPEDPKRDIRKR
jgi:hypothetical protein